MKTTITLIWIEITVCNTAWKKRSSSLFTFIILQKKKFGKLLATNSPVFFLKIISAIPFSFQPVLFNKNSIFDCNKFFINFLTFHFFFSESHVTIKLSSSLKAFLNFKTKQKKEKKTTYKQQLQKKFESLIAIISAVFYPF